MGLDRMEKLTMAILFTLDFRALRLFLHSEVFADEAEFQKKLFHALHIQAGGVMAVIVSIRAISSLPSVKNLS